MDRTFSVEIDSRVESSGCTQQVQSCLTIITLAGSIHLGLRQNDKRCAGIVPLELDLVAFEEGFLRDRIVELGNHKHLD